MVRGQTPEDFRSETLSADVDLRCSLSQARAGLADRAVWRFPGMPPCARKSNGSSVQQELDLPLLGRRTQTVMISSEVKRGPKGVTKVAFSSLGELLSVSGSWTIARGKQQVNAALTVGYTASGALMEEAVNELRRRSPLPIRTDADAILTRAVEEFLREHFARDVASYQARVCQLLEGPA